MNRFSLDRAGPEVPSESLPEDGRIGGPPIAQTILAIAFLIVVTLLSFLAVAFIGRLLGNNEATYWLIELIFAILCAGACWRFSRCPINSQYSWKPGTGKTWWRRCDGDRRFRARLTSEAGGTRRTHLCTANSKRSPQPGCGQH